MRARARRRPLAGWVVFLALSALAIAIAWSPLARSAEPMAPKDVPDPLKPWVPWVLYGKADATCPVIQGGTTTCAWPTRLDLALGDQGGTFTEEWRIDDKRYVPLPGDERRWPQSVTVDGKKAVVVPREGHPSVELAVGAHRIVGAFAWDSLPESLAVPPETGLLTLDVRGKRIDVPVRDAQGVVWLQKASGGEAGEALEIVVHRRVEDDVPLRLTTRIQLAIAGKNREIVLGKALPPGFIPLALDSQLPARIEPDSRLRIQARAGTYVIELTARSEGPVATLERPVPDGPWRDGDEVWVFQARPELRVVEIEGASAIDPQQTTLPDAWKKLPAYPMKIGTKLALVEKRRGDADPPPDQLTLRRRMWLDFDGSGVTMSDQLTGTLSRSTRLEMQKPTVLGRVSSRGKDQFITHLEDASRLGVEIRQGDLDVTADSRFAGDVAHVPSVGWNHDFAHVSATLFVPPGYRLLHASGVDEVPGTWLRHWTLLEIFLVLVLALATARLFGIGWGVLALVTLVLTVPEDDAPKWIWAVMLAFEALVRVLPHGRVKKIFAATRFAVAMLLVLFAIPFLVQHVREGMYPALARVHAAPLGFVEAPLEAKKDKSGPVPGVKEPESAAAASAGEAASAQAIDQTKPEERPAPSKANAPNNKQEWQQARDESLSSGYGRGALGGLATRQAAQLNVDVYDPNAMVQTGPGLPSWTWSSLDLRWSGPVERGQELRLWWVGPTGNLLLALLRAVLVAALLLRLMPFFDRLARFGRGGGPRSGTGAPVAIGVAVLLGLLASSPRAAFADVAPDKDTLAELERRLLATPSCAPNCASSARLALDVQARSLRGRMAVDAAAKIAVPLPGSASQWLPSRVEVDGKAATGLLLRDGKLYVALDPGSHEIVLEGALPDRETVQIALPLKPRYVQADARGWKLEGLHEDGLADDNLQLTRIASESAAAGAAMETSALPPFVHVERTLRIGLSWQVETRVVRASPLGAAVVLEVPLLPGESVTTADVRVAGGKVLVNLPAQAPETSWKSVLETKSPIRMVAPKGLPWVETWRLDLSPIWHAVFDGIPPIHPGANRFASLPEWRPWPGESVSMTITRPEGAIGQTLTIDESRLDVNPGLRSIDATLTLKARSSRGGQHVITLPEGALLESLAIGGVAHPLRQEGRNVAVLVTPGAQEMVLKWREPRGISASFTVSPVDLHLASVNANVHVSMSDARWVLFARGPRLGPAVLFWSLLVVLVAIALALSRIRFVPLGVGAWLLLAIGLSQISIVASAFVVAWLVALGARKRWPELAPAWFDLRQLALVGLTLTALGILVYAVHQGLLGHPDMQIEGNGSSATELQWFDDRCAGVLPQPTIVSAPILVYRLAMLAWALWLAISVLAWLRFGWASFTTGGMWRPLAVFRPRPRVAPAGWGATPPPAPPGGWPAPGQPEGTAPWPGELPHVVVHPGPARESAAGLGPEAPSGDAPPAPKKGGEPPEGEGGASS
jgi:hypothetical protein